MSRKEIEDFLFKRWLECKSFIPGLKRKDYLKDVGQIVYEKPVVLSPWKRKTKDRYIKH